MEFYRFLKKKIVNASIVGPIDQHNPFLLPIPSPYPRSSASSASFARTMMMRRRENNGVVMAMVKNPIFLTSRFVTRAFTLIIVSVKKANSVEVRICTDDQRVRCKFTTWLTARERATHSLTHSLTHCAACETLVCEFIFHASRTNARTRNYFIKIYATMDFSRKP